MDFTRPNEVEQFVRAWDFAFVAKRPHFPVPSGRKHAVSDSVANGGLSNPHAVGNDLAPDLVAYRSGCDLIVVLFHAV